MEKAPYTFMAECKKHDIPTINYTPEDLEAELADFRLAC
ncbi:MAG: UPF0175 family protein [Thiothrix litoralis]|jgi:hypothetical protein|nr:UPF0175 family protein [Thiothrix litoralis]